MDFVLVGVLKPLLYVATFALGALAFRRYAPPLQGSSWPSSVLAALARYAAGWAAFFVVAKLFRESWPPQVGLALIFALGYVLWWQVARWTFRRVPTGKLLLFALAGELVSIGIDTLFLHSIHNIHMC
jgi:hypothetical protein